MRFLIAFVVVLAVATNGFGAELPKPWELKDSTPKKESGSPAAAGYGPAPAGMEWVRDPRGSSGWGLRQVTVPKTIPLPKLSVPEVTVPVVPTVRPASGITPVTTVQTVAVPNMSSPAVRGVKYTLTPVRAGLLGGTTTGNGCPNGRCPNQ